MTKKNLENVMRVRLVTVGDEGPEQELMETYTLQPHEGRHQDSGDTYCAFSADEKLIAWSKGNCFVEVMYFFKFPNSLLFTPTDESQPEDRNWYQEIDCAKTVSAMEFAPIDYKIKGYKYVLVTGHDCGRIKFWDPFTKKMLLNLSDHPVDVRGLSFAPSGEPLLISCSFDKTLKVWDLADEGNMTLTMKGHTLPIMECAFSPTDHTLICSVGEGRAVVIWKLRHKRDSSMLRQLKGHLNNVSSCSWSPDGALIATASYDTKVILWNPHNGFKVMELGHTNPMPEPIFAGGANGAWLISVRFSPDGSRLATLCEDNRLRLWHPWSDTATQSKLLARPGTVCRFSPCGSSLAVGQTDGSVSVFDAKVSVMPLRHLSRLALRRSNDPSILNSLVLPPSISRYLQYMTSRY